VVEPGENLFGIALQYGVTVEELAALNGIANPSYIRAGQVLLIPRTSGPQPTVLPIISPTPSPTPLLTPSPTPPAPTVTATPVVLPTEEATEVPGPGLGMMVEAEWPRRMEIYRSDFIRISLVRTGEGGFVPTVEVAGHTVVAETPIPYGTPGALAEGAFGPEYRASAIARLEGAAFEIAPLETGYQSLDQPQVTWDWNILPQQPGPQVLNARIAVRWEPIEGDGAAIERTVWRHSFYVVVERPWIKTGQLSLLSLISGLIGSALSVPWLYDRIKEVRKKRRKRKK